MRFPAVLGLMALFNVFSFLSFAQSAPDNLREAVEQAVNRVKPALVRIHVVSTEYEDGREQKYESTGSGVVITPEGHVVTNHHVAGHATRLFCTFADRRELEAELVGADPLTDIAVIKIVNPNGTQFPVATFGDSTKVRVGDHVLAMGSPMALSQSITLGIISNTEMIMPQWMEKWGGLQQDGEDVGSIVKWIGHDAKIAGGNSGGPLVNIAGEVIGINEISMGLAGAIPGNLARDVADKLIASGKVVRSWLGISVQPLLKHSGQEQGVLVSGVLKDSPAAQAGLQSGDILISVAGQAVTVRFGEEIPVFNQLIAALPVGQEIELVVLRAGTETSLKVTPVERENVQQKKYEIKEWGMTVSNLSMLTAKEMKRSSTEGVLVTSTRAGGPVGEAKPKIEPRAVIVEVNGKKVSNVAELIAVTAEIVKDQSEPVQTLVTFEKRTERVMTIVKVGIRDMNDPGLEVKKAWLPVETQVITKDISTFIKRPDIKGFRVTFIYPGSTAEKAGLQVGDMIYAVDAERLTANEPENYEELGALIRQYRVGDTTELSVLRGDQEVKISVELERAPRLDREMKSYRP